MTIATLKRHMDRRFDRLQRTKVDKSDLARFATRDDLARFATKDDLARFVTRDEWAIQFAAINRQFESLNSKIDSVLRSVRDHYDHHDDVLTEHDHRITDLERRSGSG